MKSKKLNRSLIWSPFAVLALATYRTPFTADEVFVYAEISRAFREDPGSMWSVAWSAFEAGKVQGRIVSPIFHFFSNFGVTATEYFSEIFSTDLYFANGIARIFLLFLSTYFFASIVGNLVAGASKAHLFRISIILFPGTLVLNRRYAAGRISVWSYLLALVFVLGLILLVQLLFKWALRRRSVDTKASIFIIGAAGILGLLFGTTYEATRIVIPSALFVAYCAARPGLQAPTKENRILVKNGLFIFFLTSIVSAIYLQLLNFRGCAEGCYQPAQVRVEFLNFAAFFARILGQFPWFSIPEGLISAMPLLSSTWAPLLGLIIFCITFRALHPLLSKGRVGAIYGARIEGPTLTDLSSATVFAKAISSVTFWIRRIVRKVVEDPSLTLVTLGIVWCSSIGVGMAASKTIADLSSPWDRLGVGSRDALLMHTGWAFIYVGGVLWIVARVSKGRAAQVLRLVVTFIVSLTVSFSQIANITTTHRELGGPDVKHQEVMFAAGLNSFGEEFDDLRCSIFQVKIEHFKEWLGHDQMIYFGLNNRFQAKYNYPYCSIAPEEMFSNYDG